MTEVVVISDWAAEIVVLPPWGGGLARYDLLIDGRREPILRPAPAEVRSPFDLALGKRCCFTLEWANQVDGHCQRSEAILGVRAPRQDGSPSQGLLGMGGRKATRRRRDERAEFCTPKK